MPRRTKIVATIGPASDSPDTLRAMIRAGMDMARVSLSHSSLDEAIATVARVRAAADAEGCVIGVLADLPGPKVRAAEFPEGGAHLAENAVVELVTDGTASNDTRIVVDYPMLLSEIEAGDTVALGDGAISLRITDVRAERAIAQVVTGGWAQGRPGVALPPGRLTVSSPTAEDLRLLAGLAEAAVDAVAISFVRGAGDMVRARNSLGSGGPMFVAKIETQEAVDDVDDIIAVSDAVMVARGDLGIRCALADVPHHQKRIIRTGVAYGRPVITATQMLESMVRAPTPTRAEVSDVANAVFDGTSALMLSGESAIGRHPVAAVATMAEIAERAEREFDYDTWGRTLGRQQTQDAADARPHARITAAVSAAAWRAASDAGVAAIIACTNSGATARAISRFRPTAPVLGCTPSPRTARQLTVAWGITPMVMEYQGTTDDIVWFAVERAAKEGLVQPGDLVAVLVGSPTDLEPVTDSLRLVRAR
ncbi:MAG TPA: pyruvate kinase [Acidimicrobiales bacterium]|nr:pyruvate kinase [Acidimicrobiales bacterium]